MSNINSDQVIHNLKKVIDKYQEVLLLLIQGKAAFMPMSLVDQDKHRLIFTSVFEQFSANPEKFFNLNVEYIEKFQDLVSTSINRFMGHQTDTVHTPSSKDRRFKDKAWQENIFFDFVKQFYLISSEWVEKSVQQYDLEPKLKKYLEFTTRQFIDAVAPTNFIFYNPQVLRESMEHGWENIVRGLDKFLEDIKASEGIFNIPMAETTAFKVGENIATTPGKVVFQNELMQLICYKPKNNTFSVPLLVVPPSINKYYILDLSPHNSLVKFLVDHNFQVFMVSWVNPDKQLAHKNFEDYLKEGILDSCEFLNTLGYKKINAVGYCIGGTLLATAAAYVTVNKFSPVVLKKIPPLYQNKKINNYLSFCYLSFSIQKI
jgi:polyhydroxyalkanoate synthase